MSAPIAFLGPHGTFAHHVARQRYGETSDLVPFPSIDDVFDFVKASPTHHGVVPIENSSGGTIHDTVDLLIENSATVHIEEELSVNVRLALVGRRDRPVEVLFSHFIPLHHHKAWLKTHYPQAQQRKVSSTSLAAKSAAETPNAAALSTRAAAEIYGLDILQFPIEGDAVNVTHFFTLGHKASNPEGAKTALLVRLGNAAGSLHAFLGPFAESAVNLTRIVSRPVPGRPNTYVFFVEIEGTSSDAKVRETLEAARKASEQITVLGEYPTAPRYES